MKRPARLQSARHWLKTYEGKNLVRGYRRHFSVDLECAVRELQMLDVKLDPAHVEQIRVTVGAKAEHRRKEKEKKAAQDADPSGDSDASFASIAGYTSGGVPYGVTWEEMEAGPRRPGSRAEDLRGVEAKTSRT